MAERWKPCEQHVYSQAIRLLARFPDNASVIGLYARNYRASSYRVLQKTARSHAAVVDWLDFYHQQTRHVKANLTSTLNGLRGDGVIYTMGDVNESLIEELYKSRLIADNKRAQLLQVVRDVQEQKNSDQGGKIE